MRRAHVHGRTLLVPLVLVAWLITSCGSSTRKDNPSAPAADHRVGEPSTTETPTRSTTSSLPTTIGASASGPGGSAGSVGREGVPGFSHVFVVLMENLSEEQALATPSIAVLAQRYAIATSWYGVSHPSLPNYLALVSGSTWGINSDCTSCYLSGPNLATQLQGAGVSWGAYFEAMPGPCFSGPESSDGSYAQKHDPFIYFDQIREQPSLCDHLQPLTTLTPLLQGNASAIPRFVWVTPDVCDDGHDCSASTAGSWLTGFVASVTASSAWKQGGVLFVTWDEGTDDAGLDPSTGSISQSGGGGNVLTLVIAPGVPPGTRIAEPLDHYSLLRTVEDAFGLPLLGEAAAAGVRPVSGVWPDSSRASTAGQR